MAHSMIHTGTTPEAQSPIADDSLAAKVASRICHDLVSPVGAISNGLELLELSQDQQRPEMALIAESVVHANTRLRLYRLAFGVADNVAQIGAGEIASMLEAMSRLGRLQYSWHAGDSVTRREAKLLFLLVLCMETALPWGGEVRIEARENRVVLTARAERVAIDDTLWDMLLTGNPVAADVTSARVQFALAAEELSAQNTAAALRRDPGALSLDLTPAA